MSLSLLHAGWLTDAWLADAWPVVLAGATAGLAVVWPRWYPGLTDSAPETLPAPWMDGPAVLPAPADVRDPPT